jgi:hypothetical protein
LEDTLAAAEDRDEETLDTEEEIDCEPLEAEDALEAVVATAPVAELDEGAGEAVEVAVKFSVLVFTQKGMNEVLSRVSDIGNFEGFPGKVAVPSLTQERV